MPERAAGTVNVSGMGPIGVAAGGHLDAPASVSLRVTRGVKGIIHGI